jgi:hypothetical protein
VSTINYNVDAGDSTNSFTDFLPTTGVCSSVDYTLTMSGGSAYNPLIFSFDSSALSLTINTNSATYIGTYNFILTG